jgi:hypothetical protein
MAGLSQQCACMIAANWIAASWITACVIAARRIAARRITVGGIAAQVRGGQREKLGAHEVSEEKIQGRLKCPQRGSLAGRSAMTKATERKGFGNQEAWKTRGT